MTWIVAIAAFALLFGGLDALWLGWAGENLYRPRIGELLADSFRLGPAIAFYGAYVAGVAWFALRPGLVEGPDAAALNGALLGALCYATYDLTNHATMKVWPVSITLIDVAWGTFATGAAATAAVWIARRFAG